MYILKAPINHVSMMLNMYKKVAGNIGQLFNFMIKGMMIPKIIHYCWYGGKSLTRQALKCIRSWETICPDYTVMRWDEHNTDFTVNQVMNRAYKERRWALVSDIIRLLAVYQYGGIYLDLDVELLKPLDYFLRCAANREDYLNRRNALSSCVEISGGEAQKICLGTCIV